MADFDSAFNRIPAQVEWKPEDKKEEREEVYGGIRRRFYPSWEGWEIIDALKKAASNEQELKATVRQNQRLRKCVRSFYKIHYWDRFWGDQVPSQELAEEIFFISLGDGVRGSVLLLQEALNLLNTAKGGGPLIPEDGILDPKTLEAFASCLKEIDLSSVLKLMRLLQGVRHIDQWRKNPLHSSCILDWLRRLEIQWTKKATIPAPPSNLTVD